MSSRDEAEKAIKTMHKHMEHILDAYYDNHGVIPDTIENEDVIRDLTKYRLAWRIDSYDDVRLSRDIKRLLDGATSSYRRRSSNAQISDAFDHVKMLLGQLSEARKRSKERDRLNLISEIEESIGELIEYMRSAIGHFTHYITSGFAFTNDIDLRIAENERVIVMASDLNTIIEELVSEDIYSMHGSNSELRKMFLNYLPQAIIKCTEDLNHTNHQLRILLNTLKQNRETARLIDAFKQRYINDPGFLPNIDDKLALPDVVNVAEPILLSGFADIYDLSQEELLTNLTVGLHADDSVSETEETPNITVEHDDKEEFIPEENPTLDTAVAVIDELLDSDGQLTALDVFVDLDLDVLDITAEEWILTLVNQVHALDAHDREKIEMQFIEESQPQYSGFSHLYDVELRKVQHVGQI